MTLIYLLVHSNLLSCCFFNLTGFQNDDPDQSSLDGWNHVKGVAVTKIIFLAGNKTVRRIAILEKNLGRSVGLVDKALGKGSTWAVQVEFDSRSGTFEANHSPS